MLCATGILRRGTVCRQAATKIFTAVSLNALIRFIGLLKFNYYKQQYNHVCSTHSHTRKIEEKKLPPQKSTLILNRNKFSRFYCIHIKLLLALAGPRYLSKQKKKLLTARSCAMATPLRPNAGEN